MKKILLIEDEQTVLENMVELLESENSYTVLAACNGSVGIELAKQHIPNLIICDIMMPEISGYDVLNALKQDPNTATIPFIFLTARSEKSDIRYGMELGADDYLTKPFTSSQIFKAIQARISKHEEISSKSEQKLNELRFNIASSLPHELRTPLNGILASSQLLMDFFDSMNREEVKQIHESINDSAKRLNRLITNYLTYADLEVLINDKQRIASFKEKSSTGNLTFLLSEIFQRVSSNYRRDNDLRLSLEDASIVIHEQHFLKICEELADNAFKFSSPSSVVHLSAKPVKNFYEITVKDNGRGMTPEQIANIGAYFQFDRSVYEQQGSGLGLTIVKKILHIYNGFLDFSSQTNEFTKVIVKIPLKKN